VSESKELKHPEVRTLFDSALANRVLATELYDLLGISSPEEGTDRAAEPNKLLELQHVMKDTNELLREAKAVLITLGGN